MTSAPFIKILDDKKVVRSVPLLSGAVSVVVADGLPQ
jgi:hypothetical protein